MTSSNAGPTLTAGSPGVSTKLSRRSLPERPSLAFLGSPNNPTGAYLTRDDVRRIAAALTDGVLVLDEAYVSFVEEPWRSNRLAPNVAVVRSFTKDFAIPGLRLGYMVAPRRIVEAAAAQQPSWSVGAPAQAAGLACLDEQSWLDDTTARTREAKRGLVGMLADARLDVHAGAANFVLVRVGEASKVRRALLERGLVVTRLHVLRPAGARAYRRPAAAREPAAR